MKELKFGILNELYGSQLSARQREIIKNYYDFDLSLSEIADNYGITRQAVSDALRKGEKALETLESEMGFHEKINRLKNMVEALSDKLEIGNADEARLAAEKILELF